MSTCDPDRVAVLAKRVIPRGIRYLDVPVSGTSDQVRRGDGVALIGGDMKIAGEVRDVLDTLFVRQFHVGKIGDGGRAKLAVNLVLGLNRLAMADHVGEPAWRALIERLSEASPEFVRVWEEREVLGMAFALSGGRASWNRAGQLSTPMMPAIMYAPGVL